MRFDFRKFAQKISPPILIEIYKEKIANYGYFGDYENWTQAVRASKGYESDVILEKVKNALLKVKHGEAAYERDSVLFTKIEHPWPVLTALLWIAQQNENRLNLVDFGGSLGSSYFQTKSFLGKLNELSWNIVEQEHFVKCGKQYFEDDTLRFYFNLKECQAAHSSNTILLLSVLQYIEKPYELLDEVVNSEFKYIVIDRTPFLEFGRDRITVQKVPKKIYDASYPAWFFGSERLMNFFIERGFESVAEFDCSDQTNLANSMFKGFIFKKSA